MEVVGKKHPRLDPERAPGAKFIERFTQNGADFRVDQNGSAIASYDREEPRLTFAGSAVVRHGEAMMFVGRAIPFGGRSPPYLGHT